MGRKYITYCCIITPKGTKVCKEITTYIPCELDGQMMPASLEYKFLNGKTVKKEDILLIRSFKEVADEIGIEIPNEIPNSLFGEEITQYTSIMYNNIPKQKKYKKERRN